MKRLAPVAAAALLSACAGLGSKQRCAPAFDYQDRWYGADAAYSIPGPGGRSLWFFGDAFYGLPGKSDRSGTRMLSGTMVGVSECEGGAFSIQYRFDGDRMPLRPDNGNYYWPLDALRHNDRVYLALVEVGRADPLKPASLENLALKGAALATIRNPDDPPSAWSVRVRKLAKTGAAIPGGGIATARGYAYLLTYFTTTPGKSPVGVARFPLSTLAPEGEPGEAIEYLAADGQWTAGLPAAPEKAKLVFDDDATEVSLKRLSNGNWIAVYNYARGFGKAKPSDPTPGARVWFRTAPHPAGPWSPRKLLFTIDAKARTGGKDDPTVFCYAAKIHPQFERDGKVPLTTVCNSMDLFGSMIKYRRLYVPQVDWVALPKE